MNLRFPYKAGKSLTRRVTLFRGVGVSVAPGGRALYLWLRYYRPKMGTQCATTHALFMLRHNVCLCSAPFGTINLQQRNSRTEKLEAEESLHYNTGLSRCSFN